MFPTHVWPPPVLLEQSGLMYTFKNVALHFNLVPSDVEEEKGWTRVCVGGGMESDTESQRTVAETKLGENGYKSLPGER